MVHGKYVYLHFENFSVVHNPNLIKQIECLVTFFSGLNEENIFRMCRTSANFKY